MSRVRTFLIGSAIAALTVVGTPFAAQAAAQSSPDGNLHTYFDYNFQNYCAGWRGSSPDWGGCRNQVSSLWNNGYPGALDDVNVYWDVNYGGAFRGVHNGVQLSDLRNWTFDQGGAGRGESLDNNISSHRWVNL